jgi:mandelamide amidase
MFAGGSSGGTAAAVSAGLVPAGLGTDTGGSVRIPAALTGVVGFRPSTGRYDSSAVTPISHTRDTVGVIARSVADILLFDSAIAGHDTDFQPVEPKRVRLGLAKSYYYADLDSQSAAVIDATLAKIADAGVTLVDADPRGIEGLLARSAFPIALYEVKRDFPVYLAAHSVGVEISEIVAAAASPDVQGIFGLIAGDKGITDAAYADALAARAELREVFTMYFEQHDLDAMIFPTTLLPARPIEGSISTVLLNGKSVPTFATYIHNTDPATIAALPGISLPVGLTAAGLPVGIELDGPEKSDRMLLGIAALLEPIIAYSAQPVATH